MNRIEITKEKEDDREFEVFKVTQGGFYVDGKFDGEVAMELYNLNSLASDQKGLAIIFQDKTAQETGDYLPIDLNKSELKRMIMFLKRLYISIED